MTEKNLNPLRIDLCVTAGAWPRHGLRPRLERVILETLKMQRRRRLSPQQKLHVDVTLTNDTFIQKLNKEKRKFNKPTNVLSFPLNPSSKDPVALLGDLVLAYETIAAEARAEGKRFWDHFDHLVVHGTLHLLGYNHETQGQARTMERLEIEILKRFGIANPYAPVLAPRPARPRKSQARRKRQKR